MDVHNVTLNINMLQKCLGRNIKIVHKMFGKVGLAELINIYYLTVSITVLECCPSTCERPTKGSFYL